MQAKYLLYINPSEDKTCRSTGLCCDFKIIKGQERKLLWRDTVSKWVILASVGPSHTCQELSFILITIKGLVKIWLYNELTQKTFTDDQITRLEVSPQDNELWHYGGVLWEYTTISRDWTGAAEGDWLRRVHPTLSFSLFLFFHQQSCSRGRGVIFSTSSQTNHAVHLMCKKDDDCGLKRKWVTEEYCCLFNIPSCHGNCRADEKC